MIRILIVEDHSNVRDALMQAFASAADLRVVGLATNQQEAMQFIETNRADVLLVDLCLPRGGDGTTVIRRAARLWGNTCARAVLTAHRNEANLMDAFRAGAVGYLDKSTDPATWAGLVRQLAQGKSPLNLELVGMFKQAFDTPGLSLGAQPHPSWLKMLRLMGNGYVFADMPTSQGIDADTAGRIARQLYECLHEPPVALSDREMELLQLLANKRELAECAQHMLISAHTVKSHSQKLYAKLGVSDKTTAVLEARRLGLIA